MIQAKCCHTRNLSTVSLPQLKIEEEPTCLRIPWRTLGHKSHSVEVLTPSSSNAEPSKDTLALDDSCLHCHAAASVASVASIALIQNQLC